MRLFAFVPCALAVLCKPTVLPAQTRPQPNMVLTIHAGTVIGHELWSIDKQPLSKLGSSPTEYDTLRLSRAISSGLALGVSATYFPSPHVGVHAEVSYLGLGIDSSCEGVFFHGDSVGGSIDLRRNAQVCEEIQSQSLGGSAIAILAGMTLRASPRGAFSPYLRGSVGFVNLSRSTIDVSGIYFDGVGSFFERQVILDSNPRHSSVLLNTAVGFTSPLGPGYQFRLELRDVVTTFDRVTGPANGLAIAPTASKMYHHFAFTLGFDVVMEKKRGRRY